MNEEPRRLIEDCAALLLDFDGPMTKLLPPPKNVELADAARGPLLAVGQELTEDIATTTDHLKVLRWTGGHAPDQLAAVEAVIVAGEIDAAKVSEPTDGLIELLRHHGHKTVVVTNNAPEAVKEFLKRPGLTTAIIPVVGRPLGRCQLMKPSPALVERALTLVGAKSTASALIGDHASDMIAARRTGVAPVGYAQDTRHRAELTPLDVPIISSLHDLLG